MYSEKAKNYCKISSIDLSYALAVKSTVDISQNFVAFSEYMKFTWQNKKGETFVGMLVFCCLFYCRQMIKIQKRQAKDEYPNKHSVLLVLSELYFKSKYLILCRRHAINRFFYRMYAIKFFDRIISLTNDYCFLCHKVKPH